MAQGISFDGILDQVLALLQREQRVSYRALKRRFELDDKYIEDLKVEIIKAKQLAIDEDGEVLVWTGESLPESVRVLDTPQSGRRQLTMMFCDLVGSVALSEQLDPEELHDTMRAYQKACGDVVHRHNGYIAQYLGDGLVIYFGYPTASEEDARQAVLAGLEILDALGRLELAPPLQVRIGIHTGSVMLGEIGEEGKREQVAVGETPNIAARIQTAAEPDTLVVSAATYRLVRGFFDCRDLGPHELKGISVPLSLYHVLGAGPAQSRFDVAVQTGLTPFMGRDGELASLQHSWEHAKAGAGQVVLLSAEAGIGKSRLLQVLKEQMADEAYLRVECYCLPFYQNTALYPIIVYLQRLLRLNQDALPGTQLDKLRRALEPYGLASDEQLGLIAALLSVPLPRTFRP